MRNTFIQELVNQARSNSNIALIVGDLGYSVVEPFADEFPDRFINAGVAEQNMSGLAAGMASEGYHVFTYSIANFPTFRCAEQIRNDIAYHNLPVTIVAVGGGLAYGSLGYSHHAVQDYALIRTMPNMLIAAPGDPLEVKSCMNFLIKNPQPSYLRLGKSGEKIFHSTMPTVEPGRWQLVSKGSSSENQAILTTGAALEVAISKKIEKNDNFPDIYSLPLWSMKAKNTQAEQLRKYSVVTTVEDHLLDGGFGSWILESLNQDQNFGTRVQIKALNEAVCGIVGSQNVLNSWAGLNFN